MGKLFPERGVILHKPDSAIEVKYMKRIKLAAAILTLTGIMSLSANAGQWKSSNYGWWYDNENGTWPANTWQWIDGNDDGVAECYYFDKYGYCVMNQTTPDGYTVNENGAWTIKGLVQIKTAASNGTANQNVADTAVYQEAETAYKKYLRTIDTNKEFPVRYELVYLDDDEIPELLYANGGAHNSHVKICMYQNGQVIPVARSGEVMGFGQFGTLTFYPKTGYIKNIYSIFGTETDTYYSIQGSTATELASAYYFYDKPTDNEFSIKCVETTQENAENYIRQLVGSFTESAFDYYRAQSL